MSTLAIQSAADLTQAQKAAALVIAMGTRNAARMLSYLSEDEVESLASEIAKLRHIPAVVLFEIVQELQREATARKAEFRGGVDFARGLLVEWNGIRGGEIADSLGDASE